MCASARERLRLHHTASPHNLPCPPLSSLTLTNLSLAQPKKEKVWWRRKAAASASAAAAMEMEAVSGGGGGGGGGDGGAEDELDAADETD